MIVVIAPDSFKECATAAEVAGAIAAGWLCADPEAELRIVPLADGGEGTVETLAASRGQIQEAVVTGPMGEPVTARWALLDDGTAVIEMQAQDQGLGQPGSTARGSAPDDSDVGERHIEGHADSVRRGGRNTAHGADAVCLCGGEREAAGGDSGAGITAKDKGQRACKVDDGRSLRAARVALRGYLFLKRPRVYNGASRAMP